MITTRTSGVGPSEAPPISTVDQLMDLLAACEDVWDMPDRSGDPVDILDHHRQCAELLRRDHPGDEELQVAGLVHDIGHTITSLALGAAVPGGAAPIGSLAALGRVLVPGDDAGHGMHGAAAVRGLLGQRVARLVELHVVAKRYLAATDSRHAASLSPSSQRTLVAQGGPMSAAEAAAFEADPDFDAALTLRRADDAGKVVGLAVGALESWRPVVERVAARR